METLVNKQNSQVKITAPEIETLYDKYHRIKYYYIKDLRMGLLRENWTLVEEEPEKEEICSKCVYHKKDDGYCYYPHGGMKRRINENGVYECTAFWEREQEEQEPVEWSEEDEKNIGKLHRLLVICQSEKKIIPTSEYEKLDKWLKSLRPQPKRKQSPALKKIVDNLSEEKLAKTRAEMKTVKEEPEGWNKADCVKEIPFSLIYEEFAEHWRLGKAVEPGDYYIPISRLRWGIKGNLEEIPSNVDLEKEIKKHTDLFHADIEYPLRLTAIKFYELGRKGGSK